jgi:hypothetical protein
VTRTGFRADHISFGYGAARAGAKAFGLDCCFFNRSYICMFVKSYLTPGGIGRVSKTGFKYDLSVGGKIVAVKFYGNFFLISRPHYNSELRLWVPYASITWAEQRTSHYEQLENTSDLFESEAEALAFGFLAAGAWVDEHLNVGQLV